MSFYNNYESNFLQKTNNENFYINQDFSKPFESLIPIVNKLQDIFQNVGSGEIQLPEIVVIGSQSSGKSSVLESIVGKDFLPRGSGVVTRCPLILQLHHVKKDNIDYRNALDGTMKLNEWGKFLHNGNKVYSDFEDIRNEIIAETERIAGDNKNISSKPICLSIFSDQVVNLTLVDLPGITKVPVGDQADNIEEQIKNLIMEYISNLNSIILAVSPANIDFSNSESIKLAREVDPNGNRTLAVLTKLDLVDRGTDASDVLNGRVIPVKLGIIGCVNRSQEDIIMKKKIKNVLKDEETFLEKYYPTIAQQNGTKYLARKLGEILHNHIEECLPDIENNINNLFNKYEDKINQIGSNVTDQQEQRAILYKILEKFCLDYSSVIQGSNNITESNKLDCGARICYLLNQQLGKALSIIKPKKLVSKK